MAFPVVQTRATGRTTTTDTTSHSITMPASISAGDLLIVVFSVDQQPTCTASSGWTKLDQASNGTTVTQAIFWKFAAGGDTCTITTSTSEQSSHVSLRITGAAHINATSANGSSTNSNPPLQDDFWSTEDYLWIATRGGDSTVVATVAPTNFSNLQSIAAAGTAGASTNTAERNLNADQLDPGTFTSATEQWVSYTIAVSPSARPYTSTESDDFNDNSIDATKWSNWGGAQVTETSQQLNITIPASTAAYYGMDLDRCLCFVGDPNGTWVNLKSITNNGAAANLETEFQVIARSGGTPDRVFFLIGNGNIFAYSRFGGAANVNQHSEAYNATNHQYLRMRESGGTVYWEVASAAQFATGSWQAFASAALEVNNLRTVYEDIDAGCFDTTTGTQIVAVFDGFNVPSGVTTTQTITGLARITKTVLQAITGKARVTATTSQTVTGKSRIQITTPQTVTGKARVTKTVAQTVQGLARITATTLRTITGKAAILKTATQTITGLANIAIQSSRTVQGVARVTKTVGQTITGKASILKSTTKTITGLARITVTTLQTVTGKARVTKTVSQTVQGVARITKTVAQTVTGKAAIINQNSQIVTGKARVTRTVAQTIVGLARVTKTVTQTITGKARIEKSVSRTITGKSNIVAVAIQLVSGRARITAVGVKTIQGKATIATSTQRTITGKAHIVIAPSIAPVSIVVNGADDDGSISSESSGRVVSDESDNRTVSNGRPDRNVSSDASSAIISASSNNRTLE